MSTVAVIGAGPAGSVASILLVRAGARVVLIEQHRFPRDKVCGECISAMGIDVLDRMRLSPRLRSHHPVLLRKASVFAPDGTRAQLHLPRVMWGISRAVFDDHLLKAASHSGVEAIQPARCEGIEAGDKPIVRVRDLQTNELRTVECDFVLIASGKGIKHATEDFGVKAHFKNVPCPGDTIELFGVEGHYGGIAPIEQGRFNIAFSVPRRRIRHDIDGLMQEVFNENIALKKQTQGAVRVSDWLTGPLPRFGVTNNWQRNVIPIGNSAAAIEPIGGEGLGLAMRSAELAANMLIDGISKGIAPDFAKLHREYRRLWRLRRAGCRLAAMAVSSPALCRAIVPFVDGEEGLTGLALRAMGKA